MGDVRSVEQFIERERERGRRGRESVWLLGTYHTLSWVVN